MSARLGADPVGEASVDEASVAPRRRFGILQISLLIAPVVLFAGLAWSHRWMVDDGFINLRIVRQLEAGNGPVFNGGQRVEAYTSALWLGILLLGDLVLPLRLEWVAVVLGLVGSVSGLALAVAGSVRLHRGRDDERLLVPFGALVVAVLYPFWFFASGGLEGGLVFGWLGGCTFVLSTWAADRDRTLGAPAAALLGLGWLIRPELTLVSALFLFAATAGQWGSVRWGQRVRFLAAGIAVPFAYQVFRMGYFGALIPNTAFAKAAGNVDYRRGLRYLWDLVGSYGLWFPGIILAAIGYGPAAAAAVRRGWRAPERRALVLGAFALGSFLTAFYVVRVGGDYIHGRLLLPSVFALCAPVAVVALDKRTAAAGLVLPWAALALFALPRHPRFTLSMDGRRSTLVTARQVVQQPLDEAFAWYRGAPLYWETTRREVIPNPDLPRSTVGRLGIGVTGYVLGTDVDIYDELGLGDPITSRFRIVRRISFPGHEKPAPAQWSTARLTAPGTSSTPDDFAIPTFPPVPPLLPPVDDATFAREVATVRRVLQCQPMRDLHDAYAAPMTPGRFLRNLRWSITSYTFDIPPDPDQAQRELCD